MSQDLWNILGLGVVVVGIRAVQQVALSYIQRRRAGAAPEIAALAERMARIEHAVEATAIEVERIGEGQRFLTRALVERQPDPAVPRPPAAAPRVLTPT